MNLSEKTAVVVDHGLYVSLASRLAREYGRVIYAPIWSQGFPTYHLTDVGKELPGIEHTDDLESLLLTLNQADTLLCFPDILDGGKQVFLRSLGWRVWGSGKGDELEIHRDYFKKILKAVGLPVQPYQLIQGMAKLREYLKAHDNQFVKLTCKLRGITETFESKNYWISEARLDSLEHRLGMKKREVWFIVEAKIPTKIEVGGDLYNVDGHWPETVANSVEIKDRCSVSVVQRYDDLPDEVRLVCEKIAPVLAKSRYRNFFSSEIRVAKDGTPYFIDPTCRQPSPVGESEQELWGNLGEIMWYGAQGQLIEPEPTARYAVQAIITGEDADEEWQAVSFPESIRQWVKLYYHRRESGHDFVMPQTAKMNEIGNVVGLGDTMEEARAACEERAKQVSGDKIQVHVEEIGHAVEEFELMEKKGMNIEPIARELTGAGV